VRLQTTTLPSKTEGTASVNVFFTAITILL
jgi:hypothetical protein